MIQAGLDFGEHGVAGEVGDIHRVLALDYQSHEELCARRSTETLLDFAICLDVEFRCLRWDVDFCGYGLAHGLGVGW